MLSTKKRLVFYVFAAVNAGKQKLMEDQKCYVTIKNEGLQEQIDRTLHVLEDQDNWC